LNLRRTVARVAELAMSRYGAWAGVTLLDGIQLRRSDTAGTDDLGEHRRPLTTRDLSAEAAAVLSSATAQPMSYSAPVPAAVLSAFDVPAGSAERLERPGALLVTVPLTSAVGGRAVLAVLADRRPDLDELADLARRASRAMTTAAVYEEQATLARTLRDALVPAPLPSIPAVQFGASYRPAQEASQIGGDFYDVTPRPDGQWAMSIGDVCGKGISAAVLTGQVRQSLRTASLVTDNPAEALRLVNETLLRSDGTTFVTAMFGLLTVNGRDVRIRLATGGHPPPLLLRDGQVAPVPVRGTLIGMLADARFQAVDLQLQDGDLLVFYTDGVHEARGATGLLGIEPVLATLADCADLTAQAVTERLVQLVLEHLGDWPHDDIAVLALRAVPELDA
jgi:hypothetical protein